MTYIARSQRLKGHLAVARKFPIPDCLLTSENSLHLLLHLLPVWCCDVGQGVVAGVQLVVVGVKVMMRKMNITTWFDAVTWCTMGTTWARLHLRRHLRPQILLTRWPQRIRLAMVVTVVTHQGQKAVKIVAYKGPLTTQMWCAWTIIFHNKVSNFVSLQPHPHPNLGCCNGILSWGRVIAHKPNFCTLTKIWFSVSVFLRWPYFQINRFHLPEFGNFVFLLNQLATNAEESNLPYYLIHSWDNLEGFNLILLHPLLTYILVNNLLWRL